MALIFSLYTVCRDEAAVAPFLAHFDGIRWTLADGTETTLKAKPYRLSAPGAAPGMVDRSCWIIPSSISTAGINNVHDAVLMTELGNRLCEHLRSAPPFELAIVGVEVDHQRSDTDVVEMISGGWPGLIFSEALFLRAGSPGCVPFRDGMWWHPYIGEHFSDTRHVPDTTVVTCLGCDLLIRDHELVRLVDHGHRSCCLWHPYHLWCIRDAPPHATPVTDCAHCSEPLDLPQLRDALTWGAATLHHLHLRSIGVDPPFAISEYEDGYAHKRPGVSRIAVFTPDANADRQSGHDLHEYVHDACPTADPWLLRLRAAPGDDELRRVYADHLEQSGDLVRAELVRALLVVPPIEQARAWAEQLRVKLAKVSRAWLRDVCRR